MPMPMPTPTLTLQVSRITSLTSTTPGAGMDKPSSFFSLFSSTGGEFSVRLCSEGSCCQTGALNTEDDNWELGQVTHVKYSQRRGNDSMRQ